jgi:hypothetical protein
MAPPSASAESDWRAAVSVREDPELARELTEKLADPTAPRAVSVTDLVAPRKAYWRAVAAVPFEPERQRRLDVGRALHRRLGAALSGDGALEVRVRRDGLVGRIDLLSDVPVEVKTSSSLAAVSELTETRPDQVEQLAMYCALTERTEGRLVTLLVADGQSGRVQSVDFRFPNGPRVLDEMRRRADALREAWRVGRPERLPPCRWYGRGCEFQEPSVCDCSGSEPPIDRTLLTDVVADRERPDISSRIESRLAESPPPRDPPTLERFRDLLYPRRAYFERVAPSPSAETIRRDPKEAPDLYTRLVGAVESGPLGEVVRLTPRTDEPEEEVGGFRGAPYLVRTSRGRDRATTASLIERQPQYALELGFRCVATGAMSAHLILGRERAERAEDRIQAFEFRFSPASTFARLWRERTRSLAAAIADRAPQALPPCPDWMAENCPYRAECGCAADGSRSHR